MFQRPASHSARPLRLVVETDDPTLAISDFVCFRDAGFDVAVCHGPGEDHSCPAVAGGRCDLVDDADVVLNAMRDPDDRFIVVNAIRLSDPAVPIVVSPPAGTGEWVPDECIGLPASVSINGQIDVLRRAAIGSRSLTPRTAPPQPV